MLQASYDEVVQELRGLEVERETLLFQVDVLQDTLEGVEELLAEAHREAGEASSVRSITLKRCLASKQLKHLTTDKIYMAPPYPILSNETFIFCSLYQI